MDSLNAAIVLSCLPEMLDSMHKRSKAPTACESRENRLPTRGIPDGTPAAPLLANREGVPKPRDLPTIYNTNLILRIYNRRERGGPFAERTDIGGWTGQALAGRVAR